MSNAITPMMSQYLDIKNQNPGYLLFYRMGDFYELFFDDAITASHSLNITLTKRGKHLGKDIPMCGVPVHTSDTYLARLILQGHHVAVCEQTEGPEQAKLRGSKSLVNREVVRIITPGTLTEDVLLNARANNYLAALSRVQGDFALAWLDISTASFNVTKTTIETITSDLARLMPSELLASEILVQKPKLMELLSEHVKTITPLPSSKFESTYGEKRLKEIFSIAGIDAFGEFSRAEIGACGALISYVEVTQVGRLPRLTPPKQIGKNGGMQIDAATRRSLELTHKLSGERKGSLLDTIDRTTSSAGARLFASRLSAPLTDVDLINDRLDMVEYFLTEKDLRSTLRGILKQTPDLERVLSRLSLERGGPRDLAAILQGMTDSRNAAKVLKMAEREFKPSRIKLHSENLGKNEVLIKLLTPALGNDLPLRPRDGNFIADGYNDELDELRNLQQHSRRTIANLEGKYRETTGIESIKIKNNNMLGYYVELPSRRSDILTSGTLNALFIHRQTLANVARFSTNELTELAQKINDSIDKTLSLELSIFFDLVGCVLKNKTEISQTALALAELDVAVSGAETAATDNWVRPMVDPSNVFDVKGGRHPIVEKALKENDSVRFIENDCDLGVDKKLWVVTGPNMSGKSTYLRQNALITILAQTGSYVPANSAHIGTVDRLFSRVGAADDLARGRSTFMVEMIETAAILNQATESSLVILDEIGRGTATYDGLSIAWATLEYLHDRNQCRGLFATHYHELATLTYHLTHLNIATIRVKEWKDQVVFLHEVIPGAADRSYGIQVARLAGLPQQVIDRAKDVLKRLETSAAFGKDSIASLTDDLPLFRIQHDEAKNVLITKEFSEASNVSRTEQLLDSIAPDDLSPRKALEMLYRLKTIRSEDFDNQN